MKLQSLPVSGAMTQQRVKDDGIGGHLKDHHSFKFSDAPSGIYSRGLLSSPFDPLIRTLITKFMAALLNFSNTVLYCKAMRAWYWPRSNGPFLCLLS